ncbi:PH domain-containing protein [Oceanobacillus alkalisoli]|uniref:PH domain-containing protein n=1 Tax=Oceanobacillus alkalisoli TaxID=2925113 RepID=UPI0034E27C69
MDDNYYLVVCNFFIVPTVFYPDFGVWMTPNFLNKQCLMWIWLKTGYTIKNNIRIDEVHSIRETKNPFTAPALSINRVEINYGK